MTDITVIILTKDEKLHIGRCLERIAPLSPRHVFVVDCLSSDGTQDIAKKFGATVVEHAWPGNQAEQFNWALNNLPVETRWVLRIDADEYLSSRLIDEIISFLAAPPKDVSLIAFPLSRTWQQQIVRFGVRRVYVARMFRTGVCKYGNDEMDEKLVASTGRTIRFRNVFVDDNLNGFNWWKNKHLNYAVREARQALSGHVGNKSLYYRVPPYFRAVVYWFIRYFIYGGFLDGGIGWRWNFWQGLWYRWMVDRKIAELKNQLKSRRRDSLRLKKAT